MRISIVLLGLALLGLAACDQPEKAPPSVAEPPLRVPQPEAEADAAAHRAPTAEPVVEPTPEPADVSESLSVPAAVKQTVPEAKPPAAARTQPQPASTEETMPLDLSLPDDLLQVPLQAEEVPLAPLLPPLFDQPTEPESPFQLHGKLISNERVEDYWESLEGAELQFEFKQ